MPETANLEQLAIARFTKLSEAETRLVRAAPDGVTAYCGPSEQPDDPANQPSDSDQWDQTREISAELIRWLCCNQAAKACIDPRGIRVYAARIRGVLDLSYIEIPFPLVLLRCRLFGHFNLDVARIPDLDLAGTWVEMLSAEYASVKGCIALKEHFYATGPIELTGVQIGGNLECNGGKFENRLREEIETSGDALNGENARIAGDVLLRDGFSAKGTVWLSGADIGGNLECWGGRFENPQLQNIEGKTGAAESGRALNAEGTRVHGEVILGEEFWAIGMVTFDGAQIGGGLDCEGGKFENPAQNDLNRSGTALTAVNAKVTGDIYLRGEFSAKGEVNLSGAEAGGDLDCTGAKFENPARKGIEDSGSALSVANARVIGDIYLRGEFSAKGAVNLSGAYVGGDLDCAGGKFENPLQEDVEMSGFALTAVNTRVGGDICLREWLAAKGEEERTFLAKGEVNLDGVQIGGVLDCDGGKFENPARGGIKESGTALKARSIRVTDSVFLADGFFAIGAVDLDGAQISGTLECQRGRIENPLVEGIEASGTALNARFIRVGDSVFLGDGFSAKGAVKLDKARIASRLELDKGTFESLDLIDSSAASIVDDEQSWPQIGNLSLDGFVYERISDGPTDAASRLDWLERQGAFARQPYRQLAKVLRDAGDDVGWRRVCFEMEKHAWRVRRSNEFAKREESKIKGLFGGLAASIEDYLLRGIIGYGYRSFWAVRWLLLISFAWALLYFVGFQVGSMLPTEKENFASFASNRSLLPGYEQFHVTAYSIENAFPLIKLGIQDRWGPSPDVQAVPQDPDGWMARYLRPIITPGLLRWLRWVQIALGWLLTTFFVIGVTGLIRKD